MPLRYPELEKTSDLTLFLKTKKQSQSHIYSYRDNIYVSKEMKVFLSKV